VPPEKIVIMADLSWMDGEGEEFSMTQPRVKCARLWLGDRGRDSINYLEFLLNWRERQGPEFSGVSSTVTCTGL
jgi:hypothetical protein